MRLGLNTFLFSPAFTDTEIPLLETFKGYGAEVVELAIVEPCDVTPAKLKNALDKASLQQPAICGAFGPGRDLRGSDEEVKNTVEYLEQLIDVAAELNSKVICGPMYSSVGRAGAHSIEEREAQFEQIASSLRPLCEKAASKGIVLAMEPLNRFETDCINTLDQAVDIIERVGSPALKIHIDTFHMHIEEDEPGDAIRAAGSHIGHVHASASHRGLLGKDQVNWQSVFGALDDIGYEGDIVIESFSKENVIISKAASIWRTLYDSPQQLAVEGLEFLRSNMKQPSVNTIQVV